MPDMPNFIRKHVFNFRPLNMVILIRMSIYECIIKNKRLRNFILALPCTGSDHA